MSHGSRSLAILIAPRVRITHPHLENDRSELCWPFSFQTTEEQLFARSQEGRRLDLDEAWAKFHREKRSRMPEFEDMKVSTILPTHSNQLVILPTGPWNKHHAVQEQNLEEDWLYHFWSVWVWLFWLCDHHGKWSYNRADSSKQLQVFMDHALDLHSAFLSHYVPHFNLWSELAWNMDTSWILEVKMEGTTALRGSGGWLEDVMLTLLQGLEERFEGSTRHACLIVFMVPAPLLRPALGCVFQCFSCFATHVVGG